MIENIRDVNVKGHGGEFMEMIREFLKPKKLIIENDEEVKEQEI